jgi:hypothetical protein
VYLRPDGLLIVKRPEMDWRKLQDEYADYMASVGPWTADEIVGYFAADFGDDDSQWPFTRLVIGKFMESPDGLVLSAN